MRKRQMTLWVDQPRDTERIWRSMAEEDRAQVVRSYAKVIGKAARSRDRDGLVRQGEQDDDNDT